MKQRDRACAGQNRQREAGDSGTRTNGAKIRVSAWYFRDSLNRIGRLADTYLIGDVPFLGAVVFHGLHSTW